jgi:HlyD family secretion protein
VKRYFGAALLIAAAACAKAKDTKPAIQTATVQRRDIVIDAQATGIVEAINVVEVKSKASGLITAMPVETGTIVKTGDLIVQIDTRDVQNQLDQAKADLDAASERLKVSQSNKARSDEMFKARVITQQENEQSNLDLTNAKTAHIRSVSALDQAQQRFEDARITAPAAGVILEKTVAPGVVIASATGSVSGGTTLVKMADLSQVRVRARFNETDIGMIRGGQPATVSVDAYPDRPFEGLVEKIEPQAVIQQNVTMFPVLITLDNRENLLKPGMNGEVSVLVEERQDVLAVPNDAIRNTRELAVMSTMLGINADSAQNMIRNSRGGGSGMQQQGSTGTRGNISRGEVDLAPAQDASQGRGGQTGGRRGRGGAGSAFQVTVTDEECATITAAIDKNAAKKKEIEGLRAQMQGLQGDERRAVNDKLTAAYTAVGVDGRKAGACVRRASGGGNAMGGGRQGGGGAGAAGVQRGGLQISPEGGPARGRGKTGLVFIKDSATYIPRIIQLGASNYDFTEVLSGLKEGDQVVLMGAVALAQARQAQIEQAKKGMASPLNPNASPMGPGMGGNPGGGRGGGNPGGGPGGPGGGGGGNRGGGGGRGGN